MTVLQQLRIGGLTPLTTIDYPHHLSCVIYCQGCSWRCRYCHNPDMLVTNKQSTHAWEEVLGFLKRRRGLLEAVVFSGGEPLTQKHLLTSIKQVKELGFKIGLHTAGSLPRRLELVLPYVDWVGFDVKDLLTHVDAITQVKGSGNNNWKSLKLLLSSGVDYQCRTTVHWQLLGAKRLTELTEKLKQLGVKDYAVQLCRTQKMFDASLNDSAMAADDLNAMEKKLKNIMPNLVMNTY